MSPPYYASVPLFSWSNLGKLLPITVYSQIFHHSIPGLSTPVHDKKQLVNIYSGVFATTLILYTSLGLVLALYFGDTIEQACTLNWAHFTGGVSPTPAWAIFISYLVVLFPPCDVISAFPLNGLTLGNNLLAAFVPDPAQQLVRRNKVVFRLLAAIPPVVGACFFRNLTTVLNYAGCTGIVLAFLFPALLQYASINQARVDIGADVRTPYSYALLTHRAFIFFMIALSAILFVVALVLVATGG